MQFEREQFDDSLLDDNYTQETEPVDQGFQRMADLQTEDDDSSSNIEDTSAAEQQDDAEDNLDVLGQFLKERGVRDGKTIVYEDDSTGEISEISFSDLSTDEQLQILNDLSSTNLTEDEIGTINYLRQNNVTLQDVITYFQDQAVKAYIANNNSVQNYEIDSYSDDALYIADLKKRFPEMSDEELTSELEMAQSNEDLFKKKVDTIRAAYKEEEEATQRREAEAQERQMKEYQQNFVNCLDNFNYVLMDHTDPKSDKFVIENKDRQAIYDYIFKKDPNGMTQLALDLNDPDTLIQIAWLRMYGQDAITDTSRY